MQGAVRTQAALAAGLFLAAGCGGDGGGESGPLLVVSVNAAGREGLPVNQAIRIRFTRSVDPSSVSEATIRMREGPRFSRQVPGDLLADGDTVLFLPRLPTNLEEPDGGFLPGGEYRLELPGYPQSSTVRSRSGRPLAEAYTTSFRISSATPPFFVDPVSGPPRVLGTDPESSIPPPRSPIRSGSFQEPARLTIRFSEPLRPDSVGEESVTLVDRGRGFDSPIPAAVALRQTNFSAAVELAPRGPLPESTLLELRVFPSVVDLVGNPVEPYASQWRTSDEPEQVWRLEESFDSRDEEDPSRTTAQWSNAASGPGILASGYGPGGSGRDGVFAPATDAVLDSDSRPDGYSFHDLWISQGVTVRAIGSAPLVIRCATHARIDGCLILDGGSGATVLADGDEPGAPGGSGNAGGSDGGDGGCSPPQPSQPDAAPGEGPGGGSGGIDQGRTAGFPGGGGGGGYSSTGETGGGGGGGLGGLPYGESSLDPAAGSFLPGSGGGGGACDDDFGTGPSDGGGGGGAGGGALRLECGDDLVVRGRITARGGRGGDAGQGAGGGGGSGGALLLRARSLDVGGALLSVAGGLGGESRLRFAGNGGAGSFGRIRLEDVDALPVFESSTVLEPPYDAIRDSGLYTSDGAFRSVAVSRFRDTFVLEPRFAFDGSDPSSGLVIPSGTDLVLARPIPEGARVRIVFEGADESRVTPGEPEPASATGWRTNVADVSGRRFIRFRIEFELPDPPPAEEELPAIDRLRVSFSFF